MFCREEEGGSIKCGHLDEDVFVVCLLWTVGKERRLGRDDEHR